MDACMVGVTAADVRIIRCVYPLRNTRASVLARIAHTRTYRPCINHKHTQDTPSAVLRTNE